MFRGCHILVIPRFEHVGDGWWRKMGASKVPAKVSGRKQAAKEHARVSTIPVFTAVRHCGVIPLWVSAVAASPERPPVMSNLHFDELDYRIMMFNL